MREEPTAPGPPGRFLLGHLPELHRDPLAFLTRCARDYGDVTAYHAGPVRVYLLNRPDLVEYVLHSHWADFGRGRLYRAMRTLLGDSVLVSDGETWRRARRLVQPAFHRERIHTYGALMTAHAGRVMAAWHDGETRDLYADMQHITLAIVARTLFGVDVGAEADAVAGALSVFQAQFRARMQSGLLIPVQVPTPGNLRLHRAVRQLEQMVFGLIARRRASGEDAGDLLFMLLLARDSDGAPLSDGAVRDEVMTFFVAGHVTVALTLAWTWHLLAHHPAAAQRLHAELDAVLGGRLPTVDDLPRLPYSEMVVKESLRLYPPIWAFPRVALRDAALDGYRIPRGASVTLSPWVMHRDPRYYTQPGEFRPERWDGATADALPRFAYFPFGGGPRMCIGHVFAMMEAVLVLAAIAQAFDVQAAPGHHVTPLPSFTLEPQGGVHVIVRKRMRTL